MAHLTIGEIIALAHDRASIWQSDWAMEQWQCPCGRAPIFYGRPTEVKRCTTCGRPKPAPRSLGVVTAVDRVRKTVTVSGP